MKKRTEAFKRVLALLRDAAHIEGDVAQTVLETNPLIGRPARRSRRELIIARPTRGYIALYRYVSEMTPYSSSACVAGAKRGTSGSDSYSWNVRNRVMNKCVVA
jgi:hypothetical protein